MRWVEMHYGKVYLVHRLDKFTSGVLLFARTAEAHRHLSLQFETHKVFKRYQAILHGEPAWEEMLADSPLRSNVGRRHRTVVSPQGKAAETWFRVLARGKGFAWVEVQPRTGRTHQIRAHAAALGHPLLGDVLYGAPPSPFLERPALHACALTFIHPESGKELTLQAPLAEDLVRALKLLGIVFHDPQPSYPTHPAP